MKPESSQEFLFKPVQHLGPPKIFPPPENGKLSIAVRFVIPGLTSKKKEELARLAHRCGIDLWGVDFENVTNKTQQSGILVTFCLYIPLPDEEDSFVVEATARLLVERYLGLLSFCTGLKLSKVALQLLTSKNGEIFHTILPMGSRAPSPPRRHQIPAEILTGKEISEAVYSALFWLRRGLAERDPIETFSALMVSLQIMASELGPLHKVTPCVRCLVTEVLKEEKILFDDLWNMRNAVVAHGNKTVTAEVLVKLTELKFEAGRLVYKALNLALDIPEDRLVKPDAAFYITDTFMYDD